MGYFGAGMAGVREAGMADASAVTRAEVCVVACAEAWRGDGAILASPMGLIPTLGAKLGLRNADIPFESN